MFEKYNWTKVETTQAQNLLKDIEIESADIPFYKDVSLVKVSGGQYFLSTKLGRYELTGEGKVIRDLNKQISFQPTNDNIIDYLRFFCFFIKANKGNFNIIEDIQEAPRKISEEKFDLVKKAIVPITVKKMEDNGGFQLSATLLYGEDLCSSDFTVSKTGDVEMVFDKTLIAGVYK